MPLKRKYRSMRLKRKTRRGKYTRKYRGSFQTRVKKVLMKAAETKYYDIGLSNFQLYHNLGFGTSLIPPTTVTSITPLFNTWAKIPQGTNRMSRIGDEITPRGMSIKMFLANKNDRPNTQWRVIVATLPKVVNGVITTSVFYPFQTANSGDVPDNSLILRADKDKGVKFLYDKIIRIGTQAVGRGYPEYGTSTKEGTKVISLWIKRKRANKIIYDTTSTDIVNKPLAVYVIPYEQYSTLQTDNIASGTLTCRMYYKDV